MKNKIEDVIERFKKGKVGIFPTDTAFGIGCRMDNEDAVRRVYQIRNRPTDKSLLVLVSSVDMAEEYVDISESVRTTFIDKFWPGGLTIIFNCKKDKVPGVVNSNSNTLAVRLPDHKLLRAIIDKVGVPLVAPSANFSGENTPYTFSEIDPHLMQKVDFVLNGVCTMEGVSTIIDVTKKPWEIVRQGVVSVKF